MIQATEGAGPPTTLSPAFWIGLLVVLVVVICVADLFRPVGIGVLCAIVTAAAVVGRLQVAVAARRLAPLALFGAGVLALLLIVPAPPEAATIKLLGRSVPEAGARFLAAVCAKGALVVLLIASFSARLGERDVLDGLTGLRLPPKLVGLLYMILRGVHVVSDEARRLVAGMEARGRPRGLRTATVAGGMAETLIVRLGRRAETQAMALAARGFAGRLLPAVWRPLSAPEGAILAVLAGGLLWPTRW